MSLCQACGSATSSSDAYCLHCGAAQDEASHASTSSSEVKSEGVDAVNQLERWGWPLSRIIAALWASGAVVWIWFSGSPFAWSLLLAPLVVACIWPLLRNEAVTSWAERREGRLRIKLAKVEGKTGKVAKYFSAPLYRGCLFIWRKTQRIRDRHVRAGIRAGTILYFASVMLAIAAFVGYIMLAFIIAIAALLFVLWLLGHVLSGGRSHQPRYREESGGAGEPLFSRNPAVSRSATDLLGNRRTDVFNEEGKKVADIRPATDLFGNKFEEVFDSSGKKIGERRPTTDIFGNPAVDEYDSRGKVAGTSRPDTDLLGDPVERHFDKDGKTIGESKPDTDLLGNPVVRHDMKDSR